MKSLVPLSPLVHLKEHSVEKKFSHIGYFGPGKQWEPRLLCIKKRIKNKQRTPKDLAGWEPIEKLMPNAKLRVNFTDAHITYELSSSSYTCVMAAHPKSRDRKRMLVAAFGELLPNEDVHIVTVYLFDDIKAEFVKFRQRLEKKGFISLAQPTQLLIYYDNEKDIEISLTNLVPGWQLEDTDMQTIDINECWDTTRRKPSCSFRLRNGHQKHDVSFDIIAKYWSPELQLSKSIKVRHSFSMKSEQKSKGAKSELLQSAMIRAFQNEEMLKLFKEFVDAFEEGKRFFVFKSTRKPVSKKGLGREKKDRLFAKQFCHSTLTNADGDKEYRKLRLILGC